MKKINSLYWRICCTHFAKLAEMPLVLKSTKMWNSWNQISNKTIAFKLANILCLNYKLRQGDVQLSSLFFYFKIELQNTNNINDFFFFFFLSGKNTKLNLLTSGFQKNREPDWSMLIVWELSGNLGITWDKPARKDSLGLHPGHRTLAA